MILRNVVRELGVNELGIYFMIKLMNRLRVESTDGRYLAGVAFGDRLRSITLLERN